MKIEKNVLIDFLKKIRMEQVDQCLLDFTDKGLYVEAVTADATSMVHATLKKENFVDYVALGKVGVDELSVLVQVFNRLEKEIEFNVEGNLLTAKTNSKELKLELVDETFITPMPDVPKLQEFTTSFNVNGKELIDFIQDTQLNKDILVRIETVENGLILSNDGKYKFTRNIKSEGTKGGVKLKFGEPFVKMFKNIDDTIAFEAKPDYLIKAVIENDKYKIQFLLAPRIDAED